VSQADAFSNRVRDLVGRLADSAEQARKIAAHLASRTVELTKATDDEWRTAVGVVSEEWEERPAYVKEERIEAGLWSW
jgi:Tfp pilus assembly protein FimT